MLLTLFSLGFFSFLRLGEAQERKIASDSINKPLSLSALRACAFVLKQILAFNWCVYRTFAYYSA